MHTGVWHPEQIETNQRAGSHRIAELCQTKVTIFHWSDSFIRVPSAAGGALTHFCFIMPAVRTQEHFREWRFDEHKSYIYLISTEQNKLNKNAINTLTCLVPLKQTFIGLNSILLGHRVSIHLQFTIDAVQNQAKSRHKRKIKIFQNSGDYRYGSLIRGQVSFEENGRNYFVAEICLWLCFPHEFEFQS